MKKTNLLIIAISCISIFSCQTEAEKIEEKKLEARAQQYADSMVTAMVGKTFLESEKELYEKSILSSPIEVISVLIVDDNSHSLGWKNIRVKYRNSSNKVVTAIRFSFYDIKNVFNEPWSSTLHSGGYDDEVLLPGKSRTSNWELADEKPKSGKAYVTKVMFNDGSSWELK